MIVSSKNTLLIVLLEMHGIPHSRNNNSIWFAQRVRATVPTRTTVYGRSQLGWNFPYTGLDVFSKTLLRTNSSSLNVCDFTRRLCQFANLCWYEAMRMAATSRSPSTVSRSLIMASMFVFSGVPARMVGISISVGMIASISYVRANGDSHVSFRLVVL